MDLARHLARRLLTEENEMPTRTHDATRHVIPATTWFFEFPNGRSASLIPDLHTPARFELLIDGDPTAISGLTTEQAQAKLRELADHDR